MEELSFEALLKRKLASYQDNNIAIFKSFKELKEFTKNDIMVEGFLFVIISKGNAEIYVDNEVYHSKKNDMFWCKPRYLMQKTMLSVDFEAIVFMVNPNYVDRLVKRVRIDWALQRMKLMMEHEIFHLEDDDAQRIMLYMQLLCDKLNTSDSLNKQKSIDFLFSAMIYDIADVVSEFIKVADTYQLAPIKENIINRFYKMLRDEDTPFSNVNGYAERLNVSAKYFSSLCKDATGKTASQIINEEIIHTAKLLLCDNGMSIKQIAHKLGFENQSHFGTFFHRHVGVSASKYRMKDLLIQDVSAIPGHTKTNEN